MFYIGNSGMENETRTRITNPISTCIDTFVLLKSDSFDKSLNICWKVILSIGKCIGPPILILGSSFTKVIPSLCRQQSLIKNIIMVLQSIHILGWDWVMCHKRHSKWKYPIKIRIIYFWIPTQYFGHYLIDES